MTSSTDTSGRSRALALDDIADLRAYERNREEFRAEIIELKKRRRVSVGEIVTLLFENRDTIRFQIQEMARAEKLLTDEAIQTELDVYNPLIPEPGTLSATLFIELTTKGDLQHWLPRLVGIERAVYLQLSDGSRVPASVDPAHAEQLTRQDITAAVHYVRFEFLPEQVAMFANGPVSLGVEHANYAHSVPLGALTVTELCRDLEPDS
ncbi:MAG: uncharacterized protein JWL70_1885 [Acidimicrobiia bacterium]|nr:uncharacterized protein [Acidimicrobiia bacterium]